MKKILGATVLLTAALLSACGDGSLKPDEVAALKASAATNPRQTKNKKEMIKFYLAENNIPANEDIEFYNCLSHKMHTKSPDLTVGKIFGWCKQEYLVNGKFVNTYFNLDGIDSQFNAWDGSHLKLVELLKSKIPPEDTFNHNKTLYGTVLKGDGAPYLIINMWFGDEKPSGYTENYKITANADIDTGKIIKVVSAERVQ